MISPAMVTVEPPELQPKVSRMRATPPVRERLLKPEAPEFRNCKPLCSSVTVGPWNIAFNAPPATAGVSTRRHTGVVYGSTAVANRAGSEEEHLHRAAVADPQMLPRHRNVDHEPGGRLRGYRHFRHRAARLGRFRRLDAHQPQPARDRRCDAWAASVGLQQRRGEGVLLRPGATLASCTARQLSQTAPGRRSTPAPARGRT